MLDLGNKLLWKRMLSWWFEHLPEILPDDRLAPCPCTWDLGHWAWLARQALVEWDISGRRC
jgi:hypothetical protein